MGKRRAKSPFEDNPVIDGFLEWIDAPEGQQSIETLDLVFGALAHAGVDAGQRLETTHVYVEADLATKERALEKLAPMPCMPARYRPDDKLLAFLAAL